MTEQQQAIEQAPEAPVGDQGIQESVSTSESQPTRNEANGKSSGVLSSGILEGEGINFDFSTGERPEEFPEQYWDEEGKQPNTQAVFEDLKKQEKIAQDLRRKMGKGDHKAPKEASEYSFEPSEKVSETMKDGDPVVEAAKEIAHDMGMSKEDFSTFMEKMSDKLIDIAGEMGDPNSQMTEEQELDRVRSEIKKLGPTGPQIVKANEGFANSLLKNGVISEKAHDVWINKVMTDADSAMLFNELRFAFGSEKGVPTEVPGDNLLPDAQYAVQLREAQQKGTFDQEFARIQKLRLAAGRGAKLQF